jgi:glycosyltransferase involved in cell wall biosynthesis
MACGTPVVSFKVGGVPDIVRPGVTGLLAEPQNPEQLAERIVELLDDESLRARLGQLGRTIVEKEYSLDLYIQRHLALYQQAIDSMAA